jgi:glycosyltransferase involved in cell wall biosynthesis
MAALLSRRIGLVFTEHGRLSDAAPSTKRRVANSVLGRLPGRFFAVSNDLKQHLVAEGFPSHRVGVIYNGINPGVTPNAEARAQARRRLSLTDDAFVVGTAGRLDPVKDIPTLLEGFAAIRARHHTAHLVVVGGGSERLNLERRAATLGLTGAVRFTGHRDDVRELLPALDVFVNSSITEGLSVTILEAMAAAVPVVATRVGGTPEIVRDGDTGMLVEPRQPVAIARAIAHLAERPVSSVTMGAAARARVERYYDLNRMVDQYVEIYHSLARTA